MRPRKLWETAALALMVAGRASSLSEGFALARVSVADGHAAKALERLVVVVLAIVGVLTILFALEPGLLPALPA